MAGSLDEMFAPIAPAVHDFAARHGMEIRKYHHGMPVWMIVFGEEVNIAALKKFGRAGNINVSWTLDQRFVIDVFPSTTLSKSQRFDLDPLSDVSQQLEAAFLKLQGK